MIQRVIALASALVVACAVLVLAGCSASSVKASVDAYSWSELSVISSEISNASTDDEARSIAMGYNILNASGKLVGSQTKKVTLSDGTVTQVMVAGIRQDDTSEGKAGISFVFCGAPVAHAMNANASNDGGWEKSDMRSWLNGEFASLLPSDLTQVVKAADKKTNSIASTTPGSVSKTTDKLWLLSLAEVGGSISANSLPAGSVFPADTYSAEGAQYQVFADMGVSGSTDNSELVRTFAGKGGNGIVAYGEACPWWLRSLGMTWTAGFAAVDAQGNPMNAWITDHEIGVVPGFCL